MRLDEARGLNALRMPHHLIVAPSVGCGVLVSGPARTVPHSQWGTSILIALGGQVEVEWKDGVARAPVVIVPAALLHITRTSGPFACVVLDGDMHNAARDESGPRPREMWDPTLSRMAAAITESPSIDGGLELARQLLPLGRRRLADSRLDALVTQDDGLSLGPSPLSELARHLDLSPQHVSELFHRTVGLPLGRWRQSGRVRQTLARLEQGQLAASAAAAGFSDQAHMTRTLRQTVGFTPSFLAKALQRPAALGRDLGRMPGPRS